MVDASVVIWYVIICGELFVSGGHLHLTDFYRVFFFGDMWVGLQLNSFQFRRVFGSSNLPDFISVAFWPTD
jgi:hypothetical protein